VDGVSRGGVPLSKQQEYGPSARKESYSQETPPHPSLIAPLPPPPAPPLACEDVEAALAQDSHEELTAQDRWDTRTGRTGIRRKPRRQTKYQGTASR
jgi:hypothetical protein